MGKLGYKKSRNGCQLCKRRRVKCDENVPCTACVKHGAECSLLFTPSPGSQARPEPRRKSRGRRKNNASPVSRSISEFESCQTPVSDSSLPVVSFGYPPTLSPVSGNSWAMDIELMHHYSTVTYATFPPSNDTHGIFRDKIPQASFRYPYLLHQVLAISAFHLAYLRPESRQGYLVRASQHQSQSIAGIREALQGELTEENSYPIFVTSAYLMGSSFASSLGTGEFAAHSDPLEGLIEIMTLVRGTEAIQVQASEMLNKRPSETLFASQIQGTTGISSSLQRLTDRLRDLSADVQKSMLLETLEKETVRSAITALVGDLLDNSPRSRILESPELRVVFHWPMLLSIDYLALLRARNPAALMVLLYYCIILNTTEAGCWFLEGWSTRVARSISFLMTEHPWAEMAQWPLQQIEGLTIWN